jgi:hypothetical protein
MSDIVQRLQIAAPYVVGSCEMIVEAADTITTLRADNERLRASERSAWNAAVVRDEQIERLRAALDGMLRAVCGHDGFAAAIRQTSGMMYPWPALDAAEREARAALAQEKRDE